MQLRVLFPGMFLSLSVAAIAAGEPVLPSNVRVVAGSIMVLPSGRIGIDDPQLGPRAFGSFSAPTVAVTGGGLAFGPALGCEFGCRPGTHIGLTVIADLSDGVLVAHGQPEPIEFRPFTVGDPDDGGGSLEFTVAETFVLPNDSSGPLVLRSPFAFAGDLGVPGFLPPAKPGRDGPVPVFLSFTFTGTGTATGRFTLERQADGSALFVFQSLRLDFGDRSPVPEPPSLVLLGAGIAGLLARHTLALRAPQGDPEHRRRAATARV